MAENEVDYKTLYRKLVRNVAASIPEPQEYPGLDAAGFLLVALGHLVKAKERLAEMPKSEYTYIASRFAVMASNFVRHALKELDTEKEETCEKSKRS